MKGQGGGGTHGNAYDTNGTVVMGGGGKEGGRLGGGGCHQNRSDRGTIESNSIVLGEAKRGCTMVGNRMN